MSADQQGGDHLEKMLQEISRTLNDNRRFLKGLKEDRIDDDEGKDGAEEGEPEEEFEEL